MAKEMWTHVEAASQFVSSLKSCLFEPYFLVSAEFFVKAVRLKYNYYLIHGVSDPPKLGDL